jgi:hypothetical protein
MVGKYKAVVGSDVCSNCSDRTSSPSGSTMSTGCVACAACKYSLAGSSCSNCTAGKYSPTVVTSLATNCTDCDACKYSTGVGASAYSTCINCTANSLSPSGSKLLSRCLCNPGFTGANGGECLPCTAGSYKETAGSVPCTFCGVCLYSTAEAAESLVSCETCLVNSIFVTGSGSIKQCNCTRGYRQTLSHNVCIQCNPGY